MYPQGDSRFKSVGVPDTLMPYFEKRLDRLDSGWKKRVYVLKSCGGTIGDEKPYRYELLSVPVCLGLRLGCLFRIRRWLWKVAHNTEFL